MSKTDKIDRNASASAYGWSFQVGAGIKLMLENVKEFTALKMEGAREDIEITVPNGKIYAQAKSVTEMGKQNTATEKLKDSLKTLSVDYAADPNPVKLIYITNILNPFSNSEKESPFYDRYDTIYDYSTLTSEDKEQISKLVGEDFPLELLQVHVVKFFGSGENKFDSIKMHIREFAKEALGDISFGKNIFDRWYTLFSLNCSDKPTKEMSFDKSKKEIMYPVIVLAIEPVISNDEFLKVSDYDDYDGIVSQYRDLINQRNYEYDFTGAMLGDYLSQKGSATTQNRATFKYDFVINHWKEYEEYFDQISDSEVKEAVIKMTLLTIIVRKDKLNQVHKAAYL